MMHKTINFSLVILLIFLYFAEVKHSENLRSYDLIVPWNALYPSREIHLNEIKNLSAWVNQATPIDAIILSDSDHIRYFSKRSILGANSIPLKINKLLTWKNSKILLKDFLKDPHNYEVINSLHEYGVSYIVVPRNFSGMFPTVYSSEAYKIIKVL